MKKFLIAVLILLGSFGYANAQTVKKEAPKKVATVPTSATSTVHKKEAKIEKNGTHLKKDGTADKRFKENKIQKPAGPLKKDGTADMRYKANKKK